MAVVTILTATYNRREKLKDLFDSLQNQTNYNFKWLIVDDGSVDDTENCVQQFMLRGKFPIQYIKKENGGKHSALNLGMGSVFTPLTFIVDSDDLLVPNAVDIICQYYEKYQTVLHDEKIGAFSFLKSQGSDKPLVKAPKDEMVSSYVKIRIKENRPGDMAEVFVTSVLQQFSFPKFENEKFLSEDVVWIQIGLKYQYVFVNKIIYQCDYLSDGLSTNDKSMKFASPLGSMMRGKMLMSRGCGLRALLKGAIIYECYKFEVNGKLPICLQIEKLYEKMLCFLLKPLGLYFNKKWKRGFS